MPGTIHLKNWSSRGMHTLLRPRRNLWPCAYTNALGMPSLWSSISLQLPQDHFPSQNQRWQEPSTRCVTGNFEELGRPGQTATTQARISRLRCISQETVEVLLPRWNWLVPDQTHHLCFARDGRETNQGQATTHGQWMGTRRGGWRAEGSHNKRTAQTGPHGLSEFTPHVHHLLPTVRPLRCQIPGLGRVVLFLLGQGHCRQEAPTKWDCTAVRRTQRLECMREPPSKRPWRHRRQTPSFGNERSRRDSPNQTRAQASPKVLGGRTPKARAKYDPHGHRSTLSGLKANNLRKGKRRRGPRRARTTIGPRTGQHRPQKGCNFAGISFFGTSAQETVGDPMDARLSRMGGPATAPITLTSVQTNEKGGWPSSKRASPPFKQTHPRRWNRSHTTTPPGGRLPHRGVRNTHVGMTPWLSNTTPNNLKQVDRRIVLLRISLTTTQPRRNIQP